MDDWYFQLDDQVHGPISKSELQYLVSTDRLPSDAKMREGSSGAWRPIPLPKKRGRTKPLRQEPAAEAEEPTIEQPESTGDSAAESAPISAPIPPPIRDPEELRRRRRRKVIASAVAALLLLAIWWFWPVGGGASLSNDGIGNAVAGVNNSDNAGAADEDGDGQAAVNGQETAAPDEPIDDAAVAETQNANGSSVADTEDESGESANANETGGALQEELAAAATRIETTEVDPNANLNIMANDDLSQVRSSNPLSKFTITASGEASFFGLKATGKRFAFVVDRSGSMQGLPLKRAVDELKKTLRLLPERVEVHVVFFDDFAMASPLGYAPLTTRNRGKLNRWIDQVSAGGGTNVNVGMDEAFSEAPLPDAVFLLTDGNFHQDVPPHIRDLNKKGRVRVNTIALVNRDGEQLLRLIAKENRGDYRFVP